MKIENVYNGLTLLYKFCGYNVEQNELLTTLHQLSACVRVKALNLVVLRTYFEVTNTQSFINLFSYSLTLGTLLNIHLFVQTSTVQNFPLIILIYRQGDLLEVYLNLSSIVLSPRVPVSPPVQFKPYKDQYRLGPISSC